MGFAQFVLASATVKVRADSSKWKFEVLGNSSLHVYPSSPSENKELFSLGADINCLRLSDDSVETVLHTRLSYDSINPSFGWKVDLAAYVTAFTGESVEEFLSRSEESSPDACTTQSSWEIHVNIVDSKLRSKQKALFPIHSGTIICSDMDSKKVQHLISKEFLALNSDFFLALFYGEFLRENELKDVDLVAFESIMEYLMRMRKIDDVYDHDCSILKLQEMKCALRFLFMRTCQGIRELMLRPVCWVFTGNDFTSIIYSIRSFEAADDEELFKAYIGNFHLDGLQWAEVLKLCNGTVGQKAMNVLFETMGKQMQELKGKKSRH